ncbi:MAG TPA: LLM class flavin-dependent oxidoreductase, partial [Acidimicrobiales bacterium]|nr:LLM class flavin-dependent oxidoreductase [Acidimicrobiales bacterium]
ARGRLVVGVGAGGRGFDATALGDPAWGDAERHERFVEFTTLLARLLRGEAESAGGEFYRADGVRLVPGPHSALPPLLVSAMGPRAIELAASLGDGWVSVGRRMGEDVSTYDAVRRQVGRLDAALEKLGRRTIRRVLLDSHDDEAPQASLETFLDWAGRYGELGFDEVVIHWPEPGTSLDFPVDAFEAIATEGRERIAGW